MARIIGAALALLGLVAAVMAGSGLPWVAPAARDAPVPTEAAAPTDSARALTDPVVNMSRTPPPPSDAASLDMAALTRSVVLALRDPLSSNALEQAVRQAVTAMPDDAFAAAMRAEARALPAQTAATLRALSADPLSRPAPRP
ncbi:MAG: hypothetical protein Q8K20_04960 [Gemmobacter sp.]|nr:hypothetical protein [Gemmobacter sp.]